MMGASASQRAAALPSEGVEAPVAEVGDARARTRSPSRARGGEHVVARPAAAGRGGSRPPSVQAVVGEQATGGVRRLACGDWQEPRSWKKA